MKTSAVATGKRRSMLPAPKSSGVGASVAASKTGEVPARKNKELATVSSHAVPSDLQPTGLKVEVTNTTVVDSGNGSKGNVSLQKLTDSQVITVPDECHSSTESKQTQLRKLPSLQRPAASHKRPSSASSVLKHAARELTHTSSPTKTSLDSVNSVKLTSVKNAADSADQNAEAKHHRLPRGTVASRSASSVTLQKKLPHSAETTARKLRLPTKYVSHGAAEIVSLIGSSRSEAETLLNAEPVISSSSVAEIPSSEDYTVGATSGALPECGSSNSVEGGFGTAVGQECDYTESLSGAVTAAGVPDVLSRVTSLDRANENREHLASSSGSLGILDDTDLLDTSLLSFNSSTAPSTARVNEVEACCGQVENPPDDNNTLSLSAVEFGSKQSSSVSETDPLLRTFSNEVSMPSLMSNSSTDMGIVADCTVPVNDCRCQQERPSSYMSTSSADTGMC